MKPEELHSTEYFYNKGKLLRVVLIMLAVVALCIWIGYNPPEHRDPRVVWLFGLLGAGFFGLLTLLLSSKLLSRGPGLAISTAGIRLPTFPDQIVPWSAIRRFERVWSKRSDFIVLHLDPAAAKTLIRRGLAPILPEWLVGSPLKVNIPLHILHGQPSSIFDQFSELAAEAKEVKRLESLDAQLAPQEEDEPQAPAPVLNEARYPVFTYALLAILIAAYAGELAFGVEPTEAGSPTIRTLWLLGGTFRHNIVGNGEWWRLFTAPFMHASIIHLALNCFALLVAGRLFERLIGWRWFAAIFFVSALGGSIASVWLNDAGTVGVGASGGIVGLFAAVIAASFRFRSTPIASTLQAGAAQILVPSLLPIFSSTRDGQTIDYAGHFGGALTGAALSLLLLTFWPRARPTPRYDSVAIAVSAVFVIIATGALWPIINARQLYLNDPMANYFGGRYQQLIAALDIEANQNGTTAPYARIWRYFAQMRVGDPKALDELRAAAGKSDRAAWPYPVYQLFLGELKPEDLALKAADSNQICESIFYSGEWYLFSGAAEEARRRFQAALLSCPATFIEYEAAGYELAKLEVK
ncbi:rhomboid family intramembrane serine protease [Rhizobium mulingense]|uniref:rhomboid family intramembrane serine protease n=1 Tax=Rhizobium mulingense TaxID=3031128 RepID=UPI002B45BAAF|nr:rhomboid family intramembrane serine protease [Rhizobium sp. MJ21]MEB3042580.1 rhomboid family intramembrane serine protease [Rhizobium sp. MJ21]